MSMPSERTKWDDIEFYIERASEKLDDGRIAGAIEATLKALKLMCEETKDRQKGG